VFLIKLNLLSLVSKASFGANYTYAIILLNIIISLSCATTTDFTALLISLLCRRVEWTGYSSIKGVN
jgi:hypothetical protein